MALVSCCAATSVVTCIMTTLLVMLALGIGLGYNYCYVDFQTGRYKDDENLFLTLKPVEMHPTTSKYDITTTLKDTTPLPIEINSTMVVPLSKDIDLSVLIQKIKERKQNSTLHLVV